MIYTKNSLQLSSLTSKVKWFAGTQS